MGQGMKVRSPKIVVMVRVYITIAMEINTLATGKTTSSMEWEFIYSQMVNAMKANSKMEQRTVEEFTSMLMEIVMKEAGKMTRKMEMGFISILTLVRSMKDNDSMEKNRAKVHITMHTVINIWGNGRAEKEMEKGFLYMLLETNTRGIGRVTRQMDMEL